jgi:PilZ domain-containing protein
MTTAPSRRRSLRVHLETNLRASITGARRGTARVRDLAIGGTFLETEQHFAVGDSMHVEILTGSQPFESDAIARNVTPLGVGIEFVEMKTEERELLRLLITNLLGNF